MNKSEFILELAQKLSQLPREEAQERLNFYSEMIDDRIEDGFSEEEAVSGIGSTDEVMAQILSDIPLYKIVKEKIRPGRGLRAFEIILLVLGSPVWLSLIIAVAAVIFSLYAALWSVIISLWAVFVSLAACAVGGIAAGVVFVCSGSGVTGAAIIGAGIVCAGLSVLFFYCCKAATKGTILLTGKIALNIKNGIIRREQA